MPIDTNLVNWNKENEPYSPIRASNASKNSSLCTQFANYTVIVAKPSPYFQRPLRQHPSAYAENGTPKCRKFLKRSSNFAQEERMHSQKSVLTSSINTSFIEKKKSEDSMEDENELLALCSWWSDSENFYEDASSGDDSSDEGDFLSTILADRNRPQRTPSFSAKHFEVNIVKSEDSFFHVKSFGGEDDDEIKNLPCEAVSSAMLLQRLSTEFDLEASF